MTTPDALPLVYGKRLDDLDTLARSKLLAGLGVRDLGVFLDALDQIALPEGTTIFREGETGELMYFVLDGAGRIRRGTLDLRRIAPGDHFGELALLGEPARTTTVQADSAIRLARLSRSRFHSLALNHPRVALHFTEALAKSLGDELIAVTDSVGLLAHQRSAPRRLEVRIDRGADRLMVATGTLAGTLLPRVSDGAPVVAGLLNHLAIGLETALVADGHLQPLTLATAEGRAVYARSATLVVLEAARRIAPALSLRMVAILENARIFAIPPDIDRARFAARLEAEATRLIAEDVPLREEIWSTDEARAELSEHAALLAVRRETAVTIARCGGTHALGTGPLLPKAGELGALRIAPHPDGLLVRLAAHDPFLPADPSATETKTPRYGGEMALAARAWLEHLGLGTVGSFDERCVSGRVPELIRVAEGFHEKWIGKIADEILARRGKVRIVAVTGPSSSGKTTFIKRLVVQLLVDGVRPHAISLDDYYRDREQTHDFEALEALDVDLLRQHVRRLLAGEPTTTAHYDFVAGKSRPEGGPRLALAPDDVLLVEGIHGLDPSLLGDAVPADATFRIFVHPAQSTSLDRASVVTPEDVRLLRRIVRDRHQRNYTAAQTIEQWPSVRRGDLVSIFPRLLNADAIFDSSVPYEVSVLKTFAERYLLEVPRTHPSFATAFRLRRLIDDHVAIHPDHVPPTSVIREFIGGSGFEY
jgi:uridine kinase